MSDSRRFDRAFVTITCVVFALTWLKGFRLPNLWSATHFAFNYSQGFVRRGLVGEIARTIAGDGVYKYYTFVVVAFVIFTCVAVALGFTIRAALRQDPSDLGFKAAILAFGASPGLVVFIHAIGYNDYLGLLAVTLLVLLGSRIKSRFGLFYVVVAIGLVFAFIHEALVVMFGPVMAFVMVCHVLRCNRRSPLTRAAWIALIAHAVIATVVVFALSSLVSTMGTEDAARIRALRRFMATHTDFPARPEAFEALQRSSRENVRSLMPWYWSTQYNRDQAIKAAVAFAPGFLFVVYYGLRAIERPELPVLGRWLLRASLVAASTAPLLLNFVGWDWNRWNGLALVACFSCILALKIFLPPEDCQPTATHLWTLGVVVTAIGLASTTLLFDDFQVQFFPFDKQWDFVRGLFEGDFRYRPRG